MDRAQKAELVEELSNTFSATGVVVVTRNLGLTVKQSTDLRNKMRDAGASYQVAKNRLARIAIQGTPYASIVGLIQAPATKLAQIAQAPAAQLARVFGAYAAKEDA
jgi:large subunit ribosomal protein L10